MENERKYNWGVSQTYGPNSQLVSFTGIAIPFFNEKGLYTLEETQKLNKVFGELEHPVLKEYKFSLQKTEEQEIEMKKIQEFVQKVKEIALK